MLYPTAPQIRDPQILSYAIAVGLQVTNEDKQMLLEMDTVEARLRAEVELLERERTFIKRVQSSRDFLPKNNEGGFSLN